MVVVLDIEATCWKDRDLGSEVIEIGAVRDDGEEFQAFIKPTKNPLLSDYCKELTHITQEQVDSAEKFHEVVKRFIAWAGDRMIVSWGDYDKFMLKRQYKEYFNGGEWFFEHMNLKKVWAKLNKLPKGMGMARALEKEQIPLEGTHHRGIDDARNIFKIWQKYKDRIHNSAELLEVDVDLLNKKLKGYPVEKYEN
jgi:inhibitor of KinA sporulation pathway (predicted exonuclease)